MMNKKLVALLVAIATVSVSTFALFDRVFQGTADVATDITSIPEDAATHGESWRRRQDYREDRNEIRRQQEDDRRREEDRRHREREEARRERERY